MENDRRESFHKQWGTEKETDRLSHFHDRPSVRSVTFSRVAIVVTIAFWLLYLVSVIFRQFFEGPHSYRFMIEAFGYLITVTFLTFSALVYLIARQGALQRFSKHIRIPRAILERYYSVHRPKITVLIPSYSEETQVIRKTMLSAALQEYPNMKVVLLLDDDAAKIRPEDMPRLEASRALAREIEDLLAVPYARFAQALKEFEKSVHKDEKSTRKVIQEVAKQYDWAAKWLDEFSDKEIIEDHVDKFFADHVLRELADDLRLVSDALVASHKENPELSVEKIIQLYRRLIWIFDAKLEVFERKQYISLSHEPNKAMNLNSYIGLMGGMYKEEQTPDGIILVPTYNVKNADLIVNDSDFLLTLDADSVLLREYCMRLVYFLEQPGNKDVAVVQTPYSSFRGAPTRIERLSGATTDLQHIIHQGMSHYNATFWVGANAVIRKCALDDIVEKELIGAFEVKRYIQDRTVIEDTESSIDLALHDWRLVNYPERLSYSATPPDFGSLVIQRRRWANGGLLILPKLFALISKRKNTGKPLSKLEFMIRLNYMTSIAWSNVGLIFLLAYPYDGRLLSPLVLLSATPYFIAMAMDLKYCRYNYSDIMRIYGFNLILLPVNIAGTLKSLEQSLTARKTPFARTPKIKNRTSVALPYVISPLLIVAFSLFTLWRNIQEENLGNAIFAGFNAFASTWAIVSYIGIKNLFIDIWLGIADWFYVDIKPDSRGRFENLESDIDWRGILYHGEKNMTAPHETTSTFSFQEVLHKKREVIK